LRTEPASRLRRLRGFDPLSRGSAVGEEPWFHDPMCDPNDIRRRAWRYCNSDREWFERLYRVADIIEKLRAWRPKGE